LRKNHAYSSAKDAQPQGPGIRRIAAP
jgi:hypothetical protein